MCSMIFLYFETILRTSHKSSLLQKNGRLYKYLASIACIKCTDISSHLKDLENDISNLIYKALDSSSSKTKKQAVSVLSLSI